MPAKEIRNETRELARTRRRATRETGRGSRSSSRCRDRPEAGVDQDQAGRRRAAYRVLDRGGPTLEGPHPVVVPGRRDSQARDPPSQPGRRGLLQRSARRASAAIDRARRVPPVGSGSPAVMGATGQHHEQICWASDRVEQDAFPLQSSQERLALAERIKRLLSVLRRRQTRDRARSSSAGAVEDRRRSITSRVTLPIACGDQRSSASARPARPDLAPPASTATGRAGRL